MNVAGDHTHKHKHTHKSRGGTWLKQQMVHIFSAEARNMRHNRVALSLLPGVPLRLWVPDSAAAKGHVALVDALQRLPGGGRRCTDRKSTRLNSSHECASRLPTYA